MIIFRHPFTWLSWYTQPCSCTKLSFFFYSLETLERPMGLFSFFCCSFPSVWLWPTSCQVLNWAERDSRAPTRFLGGILYMHSLVLLERFHDLSVYPNFFTFCWGAPCTFSFFPSKFIFTKYSTRVADCSWWLKQQLATVRPKLKFSLFCSTPAF